MSTPKTTIRCAQCNKILTDAEKPCPSCGSEKKNHNIDVELEAPSTPGTDLELKVKSRNGIEGDTYKLKHKISGKSKRPAKDIMIIDRKHRCFTKKIHHVEEANEAGKYEVVHHEEKRSPAKHRPKP